MEAQPQTWTAADGEHLPWLYWPPAGGGAPRCVMVAQHGLSGCGDDFRPLAAHLCPQGWAMAAPEMRGQGRDPLATRVGDLPAPHAWVEDLAAFLRHVRARHPGLPVYLYGESLGAVVSLHTVAELPAGEQPAGLILASPVVEVNRPLPDWQVKLFQLATRLAPRFRVDVDGFAKRQPGDKRVTRDEAHMERIRHAPHRVHRMTLRFLMGMHRLVSGSARVAPRVRVPVLLVYAGQDIFIPPAMVERVYNRLTAAPRKEKVLFPESFHLLLHDHDKEEVLATVERWLAREAAEV